MSFFYSKNDDGIYKKIYKSSNVDLILDDPNKIIVYDDGALFYAISYNDSFCDEERKVLGFIELINCLQENNNKNVYFLNSDKEMILSLLNRVNNDKNQKEIELPVIEDCIYTLKDNNLLKVSANVDREIVKIAIRELYVRDYNRVDNGFKTVRLQDFISNKELLELYNLPLIDKGEEFAIPPYSYTHPSLFYILNGIYSKYGEKGKVNLDEKNIRDLYLYSFSEDGDIVDKIIKGIEININNTYDLDEFNNALDYVESVKKNENYYTIDLSKIKKMIIKAKNNEQMIEDLKLLQNENDKKLKK